MQTFLPYADVRRSVDCLDRQRLGKQRVEALQILRTLAGESKGWQNHPAVKMWRGYEPWLIRYGAEACFAWTGRGYRDTCADKILWYEHKFGQWETSPPPPWLGDERLHRSHRANLVRKMPDHYGPLWPDADPDEPYFWPSD